MDPSTTNSPLQAVNMDVSVDVVGTMSDAPNRSGDGPTVVIIFGWLGGKMATLRKYADGYQKLFPLSTQIVVPADPLRYWKSAAAREQAVLPAIRKLEEMNLLSEQVAPQRILIHALSNGGSMSLADFAMALRKRNVKARTGSKCAIILDSTPAPLTLMLAIRAFTASIRSRFKKYLMACALFIVYLLTFILRTVTGQPEVIAVVMKQLNDPYLLPWTSIKTPRMYFYSTGDRIVPARAVEEHAAKTRMAGFSVQMLNFGKSGHVSHARDYPEQYWEAVRRFWIEM